MCPACRRRILLASLSIFLKQKTARYTAHSSSRSGPRAADCVRVSSCSERLGSGEDLALPPISSRPSSNVPLVSQYVSRLGRQGERLGSAVADVALLSCSSHITFTHGIAKKERRPQPHSPNECRLRPRLASDSARKSCAARIPKPTPTRPSFRTLSRLPHVTVPF